MLYCADRIRKITIIVVVCIMVMMFTSSIAHAQSYNVQPIPLITNSDFNVANGIDRNGWIVGYFRMDDGTDLAFRYNFGIGFSQLLQPLAGDDDSIANASGYVGTTCGESDGVPVRWFNDGPAQLLDSEGITFSANGCNFIGRITGQRLFDLTSSQAYLWTQSTGFEYLGTLGGDDSEGMDVANNEHVCGWSNPTGSGVLEAFLWDDVNGMQSLGNLSGFQWSIGVALNENDQVACQALSIIPSDSAAFLWDNGVRTDLGILPGADDITVKDINNNGQIVGSCSFGFNSRAFIWYDGNMLDLNDLIDPNSDWVLTSAVGINDKGEIACNAIRNSQPQAVLLRPRTTDGFVLVNNTNDQNVYVLDHDNGHFIGTFSANYATQGIEIIDSKTTGPASSMLMSDAATGIVYTIRSDGSKRADWSDPVTGLRGIAKSISDFYVGATTSGFVAWSEFGTLQPDTTPGVFHDVIYREFGANKYYILTEDGQDNIEGYRLNLGFVGQTKRNQVPNPQQLTTVYNDQYYLVASFDNSRIYGYRTNNGRFAGSFPVNGNAIGVHQLDSNEYLVATTTGLHVYNAVGAYQRTILSRSGFQYLNKCFNYDP